MSLNDIQLFVSEQIPVVKNNVTIVGGSTFNNGYMFHIGTTDMSNKPYIPRIGDRQGKTEDRTVPRVTVAPTLLGCIYGYASMIVSGLDNKIGGYYIHCLPFEFCLKPTKRLVYDQDLTNEHWLVRYNKQTTTYRASRIGRMVVGNIKFTPRPGRYADVVVEILVEVNEPLPYNETQVLQPGHYLLELKYEEDLLTDKVLISPISRGDFDKRRLYVCDKALESLKSSAW